MNLYRLGLLHDHRAQCIDYLVAESRLHQAPLPQPEIAIAADQTISYQQAQAGVCALILGIIALIVLKNTLDCIRVKNPHCSEQPKPDSDNVAIIPLQIDQELQTVAPDGGDATKQEMVFGLRNGGGGNFHGQLQMDGFRIYHEFQIFLGALILLKRTPVARCCPTISNICRGENIISGQEYRTGLDVIIKDL
jgi:hypothetical protein